MDVKLGKVKRTLQNRGGLIIRHGGNGTGLIGQSTVAVPENGGKGWKWVWDKNDADSVTIFGMEPEIVVHSQRILLC